MLMLILSAPVWNPVAGMAVSANMLGRIAVPVEIAKPWLSFANHKRIPHDTRAIDCSAPNRDVDVTTYLDRVKALFG
jgi:hypothetical protein